MFRILDGRNSWFQWDRDQRLIVEAECDEVHISAGGASAAVLVPYALDGQRVVDVPNLYLQDTVPVTAWAYREDEDGGRTVDGKTFHIIPRQKPDDYAYTPTEVKTWEQLDERLRDLEGGKLKQAVADYLQEHPVSVQEEDPTVPAWAKEPQKPVYTAQEVGALDSETLQAATNQALAQAKASGEFDGAAGPQGPVGPKGPKGDTGATGAAGTTPILQIGTVTTLKAGSDATATLTGTVKNPILNLGIPKGTDGASGGGGNWEKILEASLSGLSEFTQDFNATYQKIFVAVFGYHASGNGSAADFTTAGYWNVYVNGIDCKFGLPVTKHAWGHTELAWITAGCDYLWLERDGKGPGSRTPTSKDPRYAQFSKFTDNEIRQIAIKMTDLENLCVDGNITIWGVRT